MIKLSELIQETTGLSVSLQTKILTSIVIFFILWLIRILVIKILWRQVENVRTRYIWRKTLSYILAALGIILTGRVWFKGIQPIATFVGLVSAGVAIALKDILTNIAGWVFIITRRPFTTGDRIQISDNAGDVIDIRVFQFTLMEIGNWVDAEQSTGRIIHIPNSKIFTETLANYSKGFKYIWNEVPVLVTFETNWEKAKNILQNIANKYSQSLSKSAQKRIKEVSGRFMIFYTTLTPTIYTSVKESGVLLTIRYLCEPHNRRNSEHDIWEEILKEFAECPDINFAYPTQRFYTHKLEKNDRKKQSSNKENL